MKNGIVKRLARRNRNADADAVVNAENDVPQLMKPKKHATPAQCGNAECIQARGDVEMLCVGFSCLPEMVLENAMVRPSRCGAD